MTPARVTGSLFRAAHSRVPSGARAGSALVIAMIGLFLIEVAVTGFLYVAAQEALSVRAGTQRLNARLAAQSAIDVAIARWPADSLRAMRLGGIHRPFAQTELVGGGAAFDAEIERLNGDWFLLRGNGRARLGGRAVTRSGALVRMIGTEAIWRDFPSPVNTAGDVTIGPGARVDALHGAALPAPWSPSECSPRAEAEVLAVLGSPIRPALSTVPAATVAIDPSGILLGSSATAIDSALAVATFDGAGPLDAGLVGSLADRVETGTVSLAPVVMTGVCSVAAPGNWGDPDDPASPCGQYFPLIYAPGDLEVAGGAGQGVLIAGGHVRVQPGSRFSGAISAARGISLQGGEVIGAVRSGSGPTFIDAAVTYNICALYRAFTGTAAMRRPYRRGNRWWIPAF